MFEIKESDKGVELYFNNSEEHERTGATLTSSNFGFTSDEWLAFSKAVEAMTDKLYPPSVPELETEEWPQVKGRADEILDALMAFGPLTYNELAEKMDVTYQRVVRLVSQMVRDGIRLNREGKPRKVSLG